MAPSRTCRCQSSGLRMVRRVLVIGLAPCSSCPRLSRASTSFFPYAISKTWMAGTSPAMTSEIVLPDRGRRRLQGGSRLVEDHAAGEIGDACEAAPLAPFLEP